MANNTGIRINEIPRQGSANLDGTTDLVHVYKQESDGSYSSVSVTLDNIAFQGPKGEPGIAIDGGTVAQLTCYRRFDPTPFYTDGVFDEAKMDSYIQQYEQPGGKSESGSDNPAGKYNFDKMEFTPPTDPNDSKRNWYKGIPPINAGIDEHYILYSCVGIATLKGNEDSKVDKVIVWSTPESGGASMRPGNPGIDGKSTYQAVIFTRSENLPKAPKGGSFNFGTDELLPPLSGTNVSNGGSISDEQNPDNDNANNWYIDVGGEHGPPGGDQLWMCNHQFSIKGDTGKDVVEASETWSNPTRFAADGANGMSTYYGSIYKRMILPAGTSVSNYIPGYLGGGNGQNHVDGDGMPDSGYYDFRKNRFIFQQEQPWPSNEILDGARDLTAVGYPMEGWSESIPEDNGGDLWVSHALATSLSSFLGNGPVQDKTIQWTEPRKIQSPPVDGNQGALVAQPLAYTRAVGGIPSTDGLAAAVFSFENRLLTLDDASEWRLAPFESELPETDPDYGNDALYVSVGFARSTPDRDTGLYPDDTQIEWSTPELAIDTKAARSSARIPIYTRYGGDIDIRTDFYAPTGGKFNFSTDTLDSVPPKNEHQALDTAPHLDGIQWYPEIPTGFDPIYISHYNFAILGSQGTANGGQWSRPEVLAYQGDPGINGITNKVFTLYYGSTVELTDTNIPDFPTDVDVVVDLNRNSSDYGKIVKSVTGDVEDTFNSSTGEILSAGNRIGTGWFTKIPDTEWVYATQADATDANASDSNYLDTIYGNEWSDTVKYLRPGSNGLVGLGTSIVHLYKRTNENTAPNPAKPNGPIKYYLSSVGTVSRGTIETSFNDDQGNSINTSLEGWSRDPTSFDGSTGHYLWQITAVASSREGTDIIPDTEWTDPIIFSQNPFDLTETTVSHIVEAYKRSSTLPTDNPGTCTVNLSGELAGQINSSLQNDWSTTIPDGDEQVYIVHATASGPVSNINDTDTIDANEWSDPAKWGIVGPRGIPGQAGGISKVVTLYKRTGRNPSPAVEEPNINGVYDFDNDTFTFNSAGENWSYELPAKNPDDKILWQTFATALCTVDSSTFTIYASAWKQPKALTEDSFTITPVFSSNFGGVSASFNETFLSGGVQVPHTHINFSDEYDPVITGTWPNETLTRIRDNATIYANTLSFIKIQGAVGLQGKEGQVGATGDGVLVVYADDAVGTNVTEDISLGYEYVLYHEYTGTRPLLSSFKAANADPDYTFVKFKGENANQVVPVYGEDDGSGNIINENLSPQTGSTHVSFVEDTLGTLKSDFASTLATYKTDPGVTYVRLKGQDGSSIRIKGTRSNTSQLPTASEEGDTYIINLSGYVSPGGDSLAPGDYVNVGQIQGSRGGVGPRGFKEYIHFKYANDIVLDGSGNVTGGSFTTQNGEDFGEFIGFCRTTSDSTVSSVFNKSTNPIPYNASGVDPSTLSQYTWTKVKGDPGQQLYTHIKYANRPLTNSDNISKDADDSPVDSNGEYYPFIGIATNRTDSNENNTPAGDYTWSDVTGKQGIQGPTGSIAIFASDADGNSASLTQTPLLNFIYFYQGDVDTSNLNSPQLKALGNSGDWTKISGDSLYTYIKYSSFSTGKDGSGQSSIDDNPTNTGTGLSYRYIGFSLNNNTPEDPNDTNHPSNDPDNYSWSLIQGARARPEGCDAVYGYGNTAGEGSIQFNEDENALELDPTFVGSTDSQIGMVYPAIDVSDGNKIKFDITYKSNDSSSIGGLTIRVYETNQDLADGKDRVGRLVNGSAENSSLIQEKTHTYTYNNGTSTQATNRNPLVVTPSNVDLENGPVPAEYKKITIVYTPVEASKYISLTIVNGALHGQKGILVKPVKATIVGEKGDEGKSGITSRLVEIFNKTKVTANVPAVPSNNVTFNIADGSVTSLPTGWTVTPPNAESGYKIYRTTALVTHDADVGSGSLTITKSDWKPETPTAWNIGNNRTAPTVGQTATYTHRTSDANKTKGDNSNNYSYYSFRTSGNNANYNAPVSESGQISTIGQILFNKNGKGGNDYSSFWSELDTASELLWKYGGSWILFQRSSLVDDAGDYNSVKVTVLDHSEDIKTVQDLPALDTSADVVFGFTPILKRETIFIYKRNNDGGDAGGLPQADLTYSFDEGDFIDGSALNGWTTDIPDSDDQNRYLWITHATATGRYDPSTGDTRDVIPFSEWPDARIFAQDGIKGDAGGSYFQKFLYTRTQESEPDFLTNWNTGYKPPNLTIAVKEYSGHEVGDIVSYVNSSNSTVTSNTKITSVSSSNTTPTVWHENIPPSSDGTFIWVIVAPVGTTGNTNNKFIDQNTWTEPEGLAKDGSGLNTSTVRLYKRGTEVPPTGDDSEDGNWLGFTNIDSTKPALTYNFYNGGLTVPAGMSLNGWETSIPNHGGPTVWISRAVASGTGTTDQIGWDQWPKPERLVSDGSLLVYLKTFENRQEYRDYIADPPYNGVPPVNSYHIENKIGPNDNRRGSFLYVGSQDPIDEDYLKAESFIQLTVDGLSGQPGNDGRTFKFRGVAKMTSGGKIDVASPQDGDVYRVETSTGTKVYVYEDTNDTHPWNGSTGDGWEILTIDGTDGKDSTIAGPAGNSVFICYNTNEADPTQAPTPPPAHFSFEHGKYNADSVNGFPDSWQTSTVPPNGETINWLSQKVAPTIDDANFDWGTPIMVGGTVGEPGVQAYTIKIYRRGETASDVGTPTGGSYDFKDDKLLVPEGWSSSKANAGSSPERESNPPSTDWHTLSTEVGYEWVIPPGSNGLTNDSTSWTLSGINNGWKLGQRDPFPLFVSEARVSVPAGSNLLHKDLHDDDITWLPPRLDSVNGADIDEESIDVGSVYGSVKNGGGCAKIVAALRDGRPLTQEAYDALADYGPDMTDEQIQRRNSFGWLYDDQVHYNTLYIIT